MRRFSFFVLFALPLLAFLLLPEVIDWRGRALFAIFATSLAAIILKILPMGAISLIALAIATFFSVLSLEEALSGFAGREVWLIVFASFFARALIESGLADRIARGFLQLFGRSEVGVSYAVIAADIAIAPAVPSTTARSFGILMPIIRSIAKEVTGKEKSSFHSYLTLLLAHSSSISGALFITAMAANPLIIELISSSLAIEISWLDWMVAALPQALILLSLLPLLLLRLCPIDGEERRMIIERLQELRYERRPFSWEEKIVFGCFLFLLILWSFGAVLGIKSTVAALVGVALLLATKILSWEKILEEKQAWDMLIWFSTLVLMATKLREFGIVDYFSHHLAAPLEGVSWPFVLLIGVFFYFYAHYLFASITAHVSSLLVPFVLIAVKAGAPAHLVALSFAYLGSLYGALTHYSSGHAAALYTSRLVDLGIWWRCGFLLSTLYLLVWSFVGLCWWKWLAYW